MKGRVFKYLGVLSITFSLIFGKIVYADSNLLYKETTKQTITNGVEFEKSSRLYKSGWKDIYILKIDVNDPNLKIDVLSSATEHGLKKSVENLAKENGAILAVNGDFFGSGNPHSSMGQVLHNGKVEESQNYYNFSENKYAGYFLDKQGNSFIDYIKSSFRVSNSKITLDLQAKNKITNFVSPVLFDTTFLKDTKDLDKRNKELFKIVVENNVITKKVGAGEVTSIPENGFIVVMNKATAGQKLALFSVGDPLVFNESYKFQFRDSKSVSEILTGMSAGGEILRSGKPFYQGLAISPNARQPRTALGVNSEKNKVILMVVDGRGTSVGATQAEMAALLLEYGAYDAIHLDGGGSSTLVMRKEGDKDISLINKVSDNVQRLVPNAIGIKSTSQTGQVKEIKIKIDNENISEKDILANYTYDFQIYALDENKNPVDLNMESFSASFENEEDGTASKSSFKVNKTGKTTLNLLYENEIKGKVEIEALEPISFLEPVASKVVLNVGETTFLDVKGINKDGFEAEIKPSKVTWSVDDENIGYIENDIFHAKNEGVVNVTATYKDISASLSIAIGKVDFNVESFERTRNIFMMYFPEKAGVTGGAGITNKFAGDGNSSLLLSYVFKENVATPQASYVAFEREPITLPENTSKVKIMVKGDKSGNLLKAVLKDKNNKEYVVTILDSLKGDDWVDATFDIPEVAVSPVRIDKIYAATLKTKEKEQGTIYLDNIRATVPRNDAGVLTNSYKDHMEGLASESSENQEDIIVFGQTATKPYADSKKVLTDIVNTMNSANVSVFVGSGNLEGLKPTNELVQWDNKYFTKNTKNLSIINLATKSGNMLKESQDQWRWLQSYLQNQSKNNIIINMDKNIWDNKNNLTGVRENELLHKILKDFVKETGKNVIVVSASGDKTTSKVLDNVRYINLTGLTNPVVSNLSNYKYLEISADENSLKYQIKNLYN